MVEKRGSRIFADLGLNLAVLLGGVLFLAPLVWMLSASFKPLNEIYAWPPTIIPRAFTWGNYQRLFTDWPFDRWYLNSLLVATISTLAVLFFTSLAGYAFAKFNFRGQRGLFVLLLGSTMIPFQLILIPLFILMSRLGWTSTYYALIVPFMAPALGIFLMRQYMLSIPTELIEASRMDGANEFTTYWRIVLPLARPALAALAVLTFLGSWNSFLWPLSVLRGNDNLTLPVGMQNMIGGVTAGSEPPIGASMAAASLVIIPVMILFIAVQKQYIAGLTAGSVKS